MTTAYRGDGVTCPHCAGRSRVTGHAAPRHLGTRRRRRRCLACDLRFTTEEAVVDGDLEEARLQSFDITRRYSVLGPAGRQAVRGLLNALEEAAAAGARHEAEAVRTEQAAPVEAHP